MKITVHRGANQIGGCVTEIASGHSKILIDLGNNLPGSETADFTKEEVVRLCEDVDAIFYTHYHSDHIGHVADIPNNVKQYSGAEAKEILLCKFNVLSKHIDCQDTIDAINRMECYHTNKSVSINGGEIKVTPYFVSHSAADAYMFKIEIEGHIILHTGDFRQHGYLGKGLFPTLGNYFKQVDFLIIEGTMLSRSDEKVKHEITIKHEATKLLREKPRKHLLTLCSTTDMDRLASFHSACKDTDAMFVCDHYQKQILDIFTAHHGKKSKLYDFGDTTVINASIFDLMKQKSFIMPVRPSMTNFVKKILRRFPDTELIYSMWKGYYCGTEKQINPNIKELVDMFKGKVHYLHTSGHADIETLKKVCNTVRPRLGIIPIHKDKATHFEQLPISKTYNIISSPAQIGNIIIETQ